MNSTDWNILHQVQDICKSLYKILKSITPNLESFFPLAIYSQNFDFDIEKKSGWAVVQQV